MKFNLSKVKLSDNDIKRGLVLPKEPSQELAEFIGILTGDGHVSFNTKKCAISIAGNSITDYNYLTNHVSNVISDLFNIKPGTHKRKNKHAISLLLSSQGLVSYFKKIGYYKHITSIIIPKWIITHEDLMTFFIKGVFDTDGCIFVSDKKGSPSYPCIELTTISITLAKEVKKFLIKKAFRVAGIRSYTYEHSDNVSYKVSLYGWSNLSKWIKEVGFSNDYKLNRAIQYNK